MLHVTWSRLIRLAIRSRKVPSDSILRTRHGTLGWLMGRDYLNEREATKAKDIKPGVVYGVRQGRGEGAALQGAAIKDRATAAEEGRVSVQPARQSEQAELAAARATLRSIRLAARQWAAVDRPLIPLACAGDEPVYAAAGRYILGLLGDDAFLKALDERAVLPGDSREGFGTVEDGFGGVWARCSRDCVLAVVRPGKAQCAGDRCDKS